MGLKNRITKKSGPSRRSKKKNGILSRCEFIVHEELKDTFTKITDDKGSLTQERFERIFSSSNFLRPSWFIGIRKATNHEDYYQGTDYFIITDRYGEIRFDVKSSFYHFYKQKKQQVGKIFFVWCVVICPHMSDEEIRKVVFSKCKTHIYRIRKHIISRYYNSRTA